MGRIIAVGFGHMINVDTAANGIIPEFKFIREYGPEVINWLRADGNTVVDVTPKSAVSMADSLSQRVRLAKAAKADLFVSLHGNAYNGKAFGCEVVAGGQAALEIGSRVCVSLSKLGLKNRGAYLDRRGLYEMNHTPMPAIIVEPLFVDNAGDIAIYRKVGVKAFAKAIAEGIVGHAIIGNIVTPIKPPTVLTAPVVSSMPVLNLNKELQLLLNSAGITDKNGNVLVADGICGPLTISAIEKIHVYPGDRGNFVSWVQKRLNISVDGYYADPKKTPYHETFDAICKFQKANGLVVDGWAGPKTIAAMVK